ncbi:MAG: rcp1 2, partial [Chitinophagaceae bacterium]|nr:rcp1 2 [Chitinophagaceae bacterium]
RLLINYMKDKRQDAPINILLADDDSDDCSFFKEVLAEFTLSTQLTAVHDGEQLMRRLIDETNELPHVLFLDLNMPRKNGFECLAEIKQSQRLKHVPVVIFTTSFEQGVVNQLYQNGVQYFVRKPPEFSQFRKIIQHAISLIAKGNISQPTRENFVLTV